MKYVKILLLSFVLFTANAFALSSPSQISAMMDSGNLRGAESALKDVLHSGKDTAKVHYMLAQVYQKEGRLPDARSELARANQMDPEHSYTDNAHYRPIADAINGRVTNNSLAVGAPVVIMAEAPSKPVDFSFLGYFLLFALIVGVAIAAFIFYRNKREEQEQFTEADSQLRSGAALLVQDIQKAILSEKTAVSPSAARLTAINAVNFRALNVYDRIKGLVTSDISDIVRLSDEVADIRQALNEVLDADYSGTSTTTKVKKTYAKPVSTPVEAEPAPIPTSQSIPAAAPVITQTQPQTVVVNGNSGLSVTDLLVADMIINEPHRHRDDEYFTRPSPPPPPPEFREEYAPAVETDSGNNDTWNTPSSDSGNNDSFSNSSSDSGNNDSWSSSSSDDSSSSSSDWGSSSSSDSGSSDSF